MLLQNAIQTPEGFFLKSIHRHDYQTHKDSSGDVFMVDGGLDYLRGSITNTPPRPYHIDSSESFADICRKMLIDIAPARDKFLWKPLAEATDAEAKFALKKLHDNFSSFGWVLNLVEACITQKLQFDDINASYDSLCENLFIPVPRLKDVEFKKISDCNDSELVSSYRYLETYPQEKRVAGFFLMNSCIQNVCISKF